LNGQKKRQSRAELAFALMTKMPVVVSVGTGCLRFLPAQTINCPGHILPKNTGSSERPRVMSSTISSIMARNDDQRLIRGNTQPDNSLFGHDLVAVPTHQGCIYRELDDLDEEEQLAIAMQNSENGVQIAFHALSHIS
jgi:hypothetical protein